MENKNASNLEHNGKYIQKPIKSIIVDNKISTQKPTQGNNKVGTGNNKVGTQAISCIDFNTWLNEPVNFNNTKQKRAKANKPILHHVFSDCLEQVQDPFWNIKFVEASYGKFPPKFSYSDKILTYRKEGKRICIELSTNNKKEFIKQVIEFLRLNGSIFSPKDELDSANYCNDNSKPNAPMKWDNINKKVQDSLVSYYVIEEKKNKKLNQLQTAQLRQTILLGIHGKILGKNNISVEDMRIKEIKDLWYDNILNRYYINPDIKPVITRVYKKINNGKEIYQTKKDYKSQCNTKWIKYIEDLRESVEKYNKRINMYEESLEEKQKEYWSQEPTKEESEYDPFEDILNIDQSDNEI